MPRRDADDAEPRDDPVSLALDTGHATPAVPPGTGGVSSKAGRARRQYLSRVYSTAATVPSRSGTCWPSARSAGGRDSALPRVGRLSAAIPARKALSGVPGLYRNVMRIQPTSLIPMKWRHQVCQPCDRWLHFEDNIRAIGLTVAAAFTGFAALPTGSCDTATWHEVLQVSPGAPRHDIDVAYRWLIRQHHSDAGGSSEQYLQVKAAFEMTIGYVR